MPDLRKKMESYTRILLLWGGMLFICSQQPLIEEHKIKAAFLFNFAQFTEWPEGTLGSRESQLIIGILGKDPFDSSIDEIVAGEQISGRSLSVQRFKDIEEVNAHILFINIDESKELKKVMTALSGRSILTVSDESNFIRQGGMIRFVKVNNKIRFQINPEEVKKANLKISSKVLRLAEIIIPNESR
jgi:hypothetical protein